MSQGTVKFFNESRGWGFIEAEDGRELFVHYNDIQTENFKTLTKGDSVTFDIEQGKKGLIAVNVKRL